VNSVNYERWVKPARGSTDALPALRRELVNPRHGNAGGQDSDQDAMRQGFRQHQRARLKLGGDNLDNSGVDRRARGIHGYDIGIVPVECNADLLLFMEIRQGMVFASLM
jgi:hypothetical protein